MDTPCRASTEYSCPTDAIRSSGTKQMTRPGSTLTFNMRENRRIHREAAVDTEDSEDMAVLPVHTFRPGTSSVDAFLPNLNALQYFVYTEDIKNTSYKRVYGQILGNSLTDGKTVISKLVFILTQQNN